MSKRPDRRGCCGQSSNAPRGGLAFEGSHSREADEVLEADPDSGSTSVCRHSTTSRPSTGGGLALRQACPVMMVDSMGSEWGL
jgi:hypothetical protein